MPPLPVLQGLEWGAQGLDLTTHSTGLLTSVICAVGPAETKVGVPPQAPQNLFGPNSPGYFWQLRPGVWSPEKAKMGLNATPSWCRRGQSQTRPSGPGAAMPRLVPCPMWSAGRTRTYWPHVPTRSDYMAALGPQSC